jgi:hypothetical protein
MGGGRQTRSAVRGVGSVQSEMEVENEVRKDVEEPINVSDGSGAESIRSVPRWTAPGEF